MQVSFRLTRDELKRAKRQAYYRLESRAKRYLDNVPIAAAFIMLGTMVLLLYTHHWQASWNMPWGLVGFSVVFSVGRYRKRYSCTDLDYSERQIFEIQDDGIYRSTWPGQRIRLPWTKIGKYAETEDMFLLVSPWPWGTEREPKVSWRALPLGLCCWFCLKQHLVPHK
jgi:hypothetical protein